MNSTEQRQKKESLISLSDVSELLDYNEASGFLTWRITSGAAVEGARAGAVGNHGYVQVGINKKQYMAHRLAWLIHYGEWPKDQLDHINHVKDDNRICNLRAASGTENQKNRKMNKNNSSGIVGVGFHQASNRWRAQIAIKGKMIHLGTFKDISLADLARKAAEIKHGYHANHGKLKLGERHDK